jgi:hypothetical protein
MPWEKLDTPIIQTHRYVWDSFSAREAGRKPRHIDSIFSAFSRKDLAEAIGVSSWSLQMYLKTHPIDLKKLTLKQVNEFINELKDKRPLNTKCPRYKSTKPIVIEDEDGEF